MKTYLTRKNNDIFEDTFNSLFRPFYVGEEAAVMKTDIRETETEYYLDIEMAGFEKENISLKFESGYLTVSAKRTNTNDEAYIRRERATGCSRSYYFGEVDETLIKAKYQNGVLEVVVPKVKPEDKSHSISID